MFFVVYTYLCFPYSTSYVRVEGNKTNGVVYVLLLVPK